MRLLSVFSGSYILLNRGHRYILNEVNIMHVKLPGMFKHNSGIYTYCGCVINFIGHYMAFTMVQGF